jgi:hypothetical protein
LIEINAQTHRPQSYERDGDPQVTTMKVLLFVLSVFAAGYGLITSAAAQNYPWCAQYSGSRGKSCGFASFEQCLASVRGWGGFCIQNSTYQPPRGSRSATKSQRRYPY